MSTVTQLKKLHAKLNSPIEGMTRPKVKRHVTGTDMDPFNNNSAHMSKMHGVRIDAQKELLMPLTFTHQPFQGTHDWNVANTEQRMKMIEQRALQSTLTLPEYLPEEPKDDTYGYMQIDIAPQVIGRRWDSFVKAYLTGFRPSQIVLLDDETDPPFEAMWWRITVKLNVLGRIEWVRQEMRVPLPRGVNNGLELRQKVADKL